MPIRMISDPVNQNTKYEILETRIIHFHDSRFFDTSQGVGNSGFGNDKALSDAFAKQLLRDKKIDKYVSYDLATNNSAFNLALNILPFGTSPCSVKLKSGKTSFVIRCESLRVFQLLNPLESIMNPKTVMKREKSYFIDYFGVYIYQIVFRKIGTVSKLFISTFPSRELAFFPSHIVYNWRQYIFYKNSLDSIIHFAIKNNLVLNYNYSALFAPVRYIDAWTSNCNLSLQIR